MNKNLTPEETLKLLSTTGDLLKDKEFYETAIEGIGMILDGITEMLEETGFIKNSTSSAQDKYERGRLIVEKQDWQATLQTYQSYLTEKIFCLERNKEIEATVTEQCNRLFDVTLVDAKKQALKNQELESVLTQAEPIMDKILSDQQQKNTLYLTIMTYLKK